MKWTLFLLAAIPLFAEFTWDGQNYHRNSTSQQMAAHEALKEVDLRGIEAILDVGCGDGRITRELSEAVPDSLVIGIDLSPSQIAFAKTLESRSGNLSFDVCDVQEMTYDEKFDLATSFTVLQWVPDQNQALKRIYSSLKPQGKLVITMPIGMTWQLSEAVREVIAKEEWRAFPFRDKQHFYSREAYSAFLRDAGFEIECFKIVPTYNRFSDRFAFTSFVKQWLPFVQDVPLELRDEFMRQVIDVYLRLLPPSESGEVFFDKYVYNIVAKRPSL